jgi:hypothetical protein
MSRSRRALLTLSRASEREREGTHREAMGRVRVSRDTVLGLPSPGRLRSAPAATLSRFKARERGLLVEGA